MVVEQSIFKSTKLMLDIAPDDTSFDGQVLNYINGVLSDLIDLGIGPAEGFLIEDGEEDWEDLLGDLNELNRVRTWVFLKVRMLWDPPQTSFLIEAQKNQLDELTWRIINKEDGNRHAAQVVV